MKIFFIAGVVLLLASQAGAETYSWIDDSGTHNFADDLSSVPRKYRKKVKRLGDTGNEPAVQRPATPEKKSDTVQAPPASQSSAAGDDKQLYDGKSRAVWRQEFDAHEAELQRLEQRLDVLQKQTANINAEQFAALKKDYDETRVLYLEKYKLYSELIGSARKAGLVVEMKK